MNRTLKQKARIYSGVIVGLAGLMACACLFTVHFNDEAMATPGHITVPGTAMPESVALDTAAPAHQTDIRHAPDYTASAVPAAPDSTAGTAPADLTDTDIVATRFGTSAAERAARNEAHIRERFGVIRRAGKWIPTTGGGTNLVYISTGALPLGRVNESYAAQLTATSGHPPYQWTITAGTLPPAFTLDRDSGRLTGAPLVPSSAVCMLMVTDSHGAMDMAEYILTIQPEQPLEILTLTLPAAMPGTNFSFQFQAVGGIPPYRWSASADLAGLGAMVLDSQTGELYGAIAADAPAADVPLSIRVQDAQLDIVQEFTLHIRVVLSILDVPQTPGRQGTAFTYTFQAAGGTEPYAWSLHGACPPGLSFAPDGVLAGEPTAAGTYELGISVQDAAGEYHAGEFTLEILPTLPDAVTGFTALLGRNNVALSWEPPTAGPGVNVRIVRSADAPPASPTAGTTVYHGTENSCVDGAVGAGYHYYAAFLEENDAVITSAPPPIIHARLPPTIDPFADQVVRTQLLHPNAFRAAELPGIVSGLPRGTGLAWGSSDVVSLGAAINDDGGATAPYGGAITLAFTDNVVWDGPGADFTIFENVFYICDAAGVPDPATRFMEPAVVAVSQDGVAWRQFKTNFSPRYHPGTGQLNLRHPYCYHTGFAGVNPVMSNGLDPDPTDPAMSGGDSFDIAELGYDWIRYVHIQSTGSRWLVDDDGDLIYHNEESSAAMRSFNKAGFDLDAATAIWFEKITAMTP